MLHYGEIYTQRIVMTECNLIQLVQQYYDFRGLSQPDANQAFLFLTSEIGELADALVAGQGEWVRNNPGRERVIPAEIGDVLMMLTVFAATQGIDPVEALKEKMRSKGFEI
jgi:NTP pyrophosphatase (non-canonical NTP hydrolase)